MKSFLYKNICTKCYNIRWGRALKDRRTYTNWAPKTPQNSSQQTDACCKGFFTEVTLWSIPRTSVKTWCEESNGSQEIEIYQT